ncbi:dihydrofolate synthase / folylpolyglutamate synthase [Raineyella antarctica]|uniref:tetrahydrofolate synthase n=1 Tax=Raineyella antarctica TaxID=1577474 RepID=A0A1G6H1Z6_9ACTN|nr:folylpolyglutamate synthase/dihydrofolate synthase family protein [Raineyella antarctica]SDB88168.1 dihydrofolate synthase / folylpolyglutamate synthase [Raineyella antarctica]
MTEISHESAAGAAASAQHHRLAEELTARWPEHRVGPSLSRISALCELLGDPQRAMPVIQITGTNGKGSTAIMIDALLRSAGLRTGRFSSPHLTDVRERISIDGAPISAERFDEVWTDIAPYVAMVDEQRLDGIAMTFFEVLTGMAYAAFADTPVDVAIVEVGMGGRWDATSVADASVAVFTPISYDHMHILGNTLTEIATEKAGIIKDGSHVVTADQDPEAATVLVARAREVGSRIIAEGPDFGLIERTPALGGQVIAVNAGAGPVRDLHLPLYGEHMARNAALAVAAVEAFLGMKPLTSEVIQDGLDQVIAPGRMEVVRTSPTIVLDSAHNPHGAAAVARTIAEAFVFSPLIGVFAAMRDKDVRQVLEVLEPVMHQVVVTTVSSVARAYPAEELGEVAREVFGADRVHVAPTMVEALETATMLADTLMTQRIDAELLQGEDGLPPTPGILVTGTVVGVGEARGILVPSESAAGESRTAARAAEAADEAGLHLEIGTNAWGAQDEEQ